MKRSKKNAIEMNTKKKDEAKINGKRKEKEITNKENTCIYV